MKTKSCFFIGHRDTPDEIYDALRSAIERHISEYGVSDFIVGGYGKFDRLAARAVIDAKTTHPKISLSLLLPYHPAMRPIEKPPGFDELLYPASMEKTPKRIAIVKANQCAVRMSDYLIAYVWHSASNAHNLLEYAQSRERRGLIRITLLK